MCTKLGSVQRDSDGGRELAVFGALKFGFPIIEPPTPHINILRLEGCSTLTGSCEGTGLLARLAAYGIGSMEGTSGSYKGGCSPCPPPDPPPLPLPPQAPGGATPGLSCTPCPQLWGVCSRAQLLPPRPSKTPASAAPADQEVPAEAGAAGWPCPRFWQQSSHQTPLGRQPEAWCPARGLEPGRTHVHPATEPSLSLGQLLNRRSAQSTQGQNTLGGRIRNGFLNKPPHQESVLRGTGTGRETERGEAFKGKVARQADVSWYPRQQCTGLRREEQRRRFLHSDGHSFLLHPDPHAS